MKKIEDVKKLFKFSKKGEASQHCFSLVCWDNGYWSIKVTDSWHKWLDAGITQPVYVYSTPQQAINEFLKFVSDNKIDIKALQNKNRENTKNG